jgi:small GTP-binding protein
VKKIVVGILAHVDAGKTTLSESMLYESGSIRHLGRVDNKDAFLDTDEMERKRGITIFSKQASFTTGDTEVILLDTPGHVDFSTEMERTLQVLDYAILVISGAAGVQGHTETVWHLLGKYKIPVFLFVNKMDQPGTDAHALLKLVQKKLGAGIVDFTEDTSDSFYENIAVSDEGLMTEYLETGAIPHAAICKQIRNRQVFPCYFGSALKVKGIQEFMAGLDGYTQAPDYGDAFAARVYKITRDSQGNRLTHLKITGGSVQVKDAVPQSGDEKINQIRIYNGERYESVKTAYAGEICAVTGLTKTFAGQGLGAAADVILPFLEPVLNYQVILPSDVNPHVMLPKLRQLEEEDPGLHIRWEEEKKEIYVQIMGEVQLEVLTSLIAERYGVSVDFGTGSIVYKETIANTVEGVGHFEPLRHYAEVHLLMQPAEPGSGLQFDTECSEDTLAKNWQRLILTHLEEKQHVGVLTGSAITDMRITLVAGRAHQKHTEGGDFRQATYRAVRQGLMQAQSVLLEPYYSFRMELPTEYVGRAMTDVEKMCGTSQMIESDGERSVLTGSAPVSEMNGYQKEVMAYTKGRGSFVCTPADYRPCHNTEAVLEHTAYDAEGDVDNPAGSVFCAHGAGFVVPWYEVPSYMHLEGYLKQTADPLQIAQAQVESRQRELDLALGTEEIDAILQKTSFANSREGFTPHKGINRQNTPKKAAAKTEGKTVYKPIVRKEPYLLVDGYNVIFAWEELKQLAADNIDAARDRLAEILCNYQGMKQCNLILVFDAYRVKGHKTEIYDYHNIHIVYTKEAETADAFIEKFAHENGKKYDITVATSDGLEQIIIMGAGCRRMSSRELKEEIAAVNRDIVDFING